MSNVKKKAAIVASVEGSLSGHVTSAESHNAQRGKALHVNGESLDKFRVVTFISRGPYHFR